MENSIGWIGIPATMSGEEEASRILRTPLGRVEFTVSDKGLRYLSLSNRLEGDFGHHKLLNDLQSDLERYFRGERVEFSDLKVDMSGYTDFQKEVLKATRDIPYGETASYGDIARKIKRPRAYRAVGNALNKNRTSIVIPCHRVIHSDGGLGGFGGDLETKKRLLRLEGVL